MKSIDSIVSILKTSTGSFEAFCSWLHYSSAKTCYCIVGRSFKVDYSYLRLQNGGFDDRKTAADDVIQDLSVSDDSVDNVIQFFFIVAQTVTWMVNSLDLSQTADNVRINVQPVPTK